MAVPISSTSGARAASPAPATAPPAVAAAPVDTQVNYTVRLHDLERKVDELKEQIFRSKARLNLLKETVLGGVIAGSRAMIKHHNAMGSNFKLIKVIYAIDGAQIFAKTDDSGRLDEAKDFEIF